MKHPIDYARLTENLVERATDARGEMREFLLRQAEIAARLTQAAATFHAAEVQAGNR